MLKGLVIKMINKIVQLEESIKQFKASQLLGSSSARIIPVYDADISITVGIAGWVSFRYTTDRAVNPIVMPRLEVRVDGNLVKYGSQDAVMLSYDDYDVAINFKESTGTWQLPDERMAGCTLRILPYDINTSHTVTIKGTIYAVAEGKVEYCVLYG